MVSLEKCSKCSEEALIHVGWKRKNYCKDHFNEYVEGQVKKVFDKFKIDKKSRICVALSGGKDSSALLHILKKIGCENLEALHLNLNINEYSKKLLEKSKEICEKLGVKLNVVDVNLFNFVEKNRKVCKVCGVIKRYNFNKFAFENNFEYLATGQNLNDIVSHAIMTLYSGYLLGLKNFSPVSKKIEEFGLTSVIKPLFFLQEREIETYAKINSIDYLREKCVYWETSFRVEVKKFLENLEEKNPGFLRKIASSLIKLSSLLENFEIAKMRKCKICGFASLGKICSFCKLKLTST
ncbi:MAG: TIGR00269 family protein [Candidatus Aenigmatarchaeota archaeon]